MAGISISTGTIECRICSKEEIGPVPEKHFLKEVEVTYVGVSGLVLKESPPNYDM